MEEDEGTDADLVRRVAGGDQRALAVVFDRHAASVTRYAWAIAPSRMDVEEIERLEPTDRRVCELCLIDGMPYADTAKLLNLSVGAIKQRVSRSRARLKKAVTLDEI